jgi:hypothetical protein
VGVDDELHGTGVKPEVEHATHGMYDVSVSGWKVVIVADLASGSPRSRSTTQATWSRPAPP